MSELREYAPIYWHESILEWWDEKRGRVYQERFIYYEWVLN